MAPEAPKAFENDLKIIFQQFSNNNNYLSEEITVGQWKDVLPSAEVKDAAPSRPITDITYEQARSFARNLTERLHTNWPAHKEWSYRPFAREEWFQAVDWSKIAGEVREIVSVTETSATTLGPEDKYDRGAANAHKPKLPPDLPSGKDTRFRLVLEKTP